MVTVTGRGGQPKLYMYTWPSAVKHCSTLPTKPRDANTIKLWHHFVVHRQMEKKVNNLKHVPNCSWTWHPGILKKSTKKGINHHLLLISRFYDSRMLGDVCYQRVDGVASTRSSKRLRAPLRHNEDLMCSWHFEISCGPLDKKPQFGACAHAVIPHWLTALPQLFPKLHGPNGPKAPRCGVAWWLPWWQRGAGENSCESWCFESWSWNLDPTDINKNHGTFSVDNSSLDSSWVFQARMRRFITK